MARGGDDRYSGLGLREWLAGLPRCTGRHRAATFDTRVSKVRHLPMSAARSAARLLRDHGFTVVVHPVGFVVLDVEGPLEQREMERAIDWARSLAREVRGQVQAETELGRRPGS